jgi:sugar lactone lactonase YvrE
MRSLTPLGRAGIPGIVGIAVALTSQTLLAQKPEPPPIAPAAPRPLPGAAVERLTTGLDSSGNATHIHPVPFSPDGKTLAWADRKDHTIRIWNFATHREGGQLQGHESHVLCVAYSPDGKTLASGSYDGSIRIWDLATGKTTKRLRPARGSMVYTVAFSPDGKTLASGDWRGTLRLWDVATGKLLHTFRERGKVGGKRTGYVQVVVFSPDGKTLTSGAAHGLVQFWDVATGKERRELRKEMPAKDVRLSGDHVVSSLAFSPDGSTLAAASYGGNSPTVLWDIASGKEIRRLRGPISAMTVAFSPDGKLLATAHREIRVWEVATGQAVLTIPEPREYLYAIYSASFSPDGKLLASGGQDNGVILWDVFGLGPTGFPPAPSAQDLQDLWRALGDRDAARAHRAIGTLVAHPDRAVPLLREHLRPASAASAARIRRLIADLDADDFLTREKATEELANLGELPVEALKKALEGKPSLEFRRRAKALLAKGVPANLRRTRSIRVLEYVGDREARRVLEGLTRGAAEASLTREARAALARLARRTGE